MSEMTQKTSEVIQLDIHKEREGFERFKFKDQYAELKKYYDEYELEYGDRYPPYSYENEWETWLEAKRKSVPEGFVLVPTKNVNYFSHDFNGDGFQFHNTLQEAKEAAEADLDIYRDRVADGNHIADMGEFNELAYGIVVGQAEWSVDCVVGKDDHENGEYTQYEIGTEILRLYLSEAQEQTDISKYDGYLPMRSRGKEPSNEH